MSERSKELFKELHNYLTDVGGRQPFAALSCAPGELAHVALWVCRKLADLERPEPRIIGMPDAIEFAERDARNFGSGFIQITTHLGRMIASRLDPLSVILGCNPPVHREETVKEPAPRGAVLREDENGAVSISRSPSFEDGV